MDEERICAKCGESKPLSLFVKDKSHSTGYRSYCKVCHNKDEHRRWSNNPAAHQRKLDTVRAWRQRQDGYDQQRYAENKEKIRGQRRAQYAKNREAIRAREKLRYERDKEKRKAQDRIYRQNNGHKHRDYILRTQFGITLEDYKTRHAELDGCCALCGERPTGKIPLSVDHCHSTGKYRDLLCKPCNQGLGFFHDSIETLTKAIAYLTTHQSK